MDRQRRRPGRPRADGGEVSSRDRRGRLWREGCGRLKVVADTGPLLAAADRRDPAHALAASLVEALGRSLLIPLPVVVEVDHLLRSHVGSRSARLFLASVSDGEYSVVPLTVGPLKRAVEIDAEFADLDLGLADTAVMAIAERDDLPILTFDFEHFRATRPRQGFWRLVIDEARYREATDRL